MGARDNSWKVAVGLLDTVQVGASGLYAASAGIRATAHNVANGTTPGFARRRVEQSVVQPLQQGALFLGAGVQVDAIARDQSALLGVQQMAAAGDASASATLFQSLSQAEPLVNETFSSGPRTRLGEFFDALTSATADPSDPALRTGVVESAEDLADAIARTAEGFERLSQEFAEQMQIEIPPLSQKLQQVAMLNQRLAAAGGASAAPDIADQLDRLVRELGEDIGVTAVVRVDGTTDLYLQGQAVVSSGEARSIRFAEPNRLLVAVGEGAVEVEPGGKLGGYAQAIDAVASYQSQLDTFVADFATAVNAVQTGGFDATGAAGTPLFTFDASDPAASLSVADGFTGTSLAFASTTPAAAGDGSQLALFLDLEGAPLASGRTPGDTLSALTNAVSVDLASAAAQAERDALVASDLDQLSASLYGVDLDEEAVNLTTYQTAYQASARVVTATNELLGTLLELT